MKDVNSISMNIKAKQWMERITECRESNMSVKEYCKQNGLCEQTYYNWLKRLRTVAIENNIVDVPSFVPVPTQEVVSKSNETITISKGEIHIDIPTSTNPEVIMNMIKALC